MRIHAGFALIVSLAPFAGPEAHAFGGDDGWVEGWRQGLSEAIVAHDVGDEIFVTCAQQAMPGAAAAGFVLARANSTGSTALGLYNGHRQSFGLSTGGVSADFIICTVKYIYVIESLKQYLSARAVRKTPTPAASP